MRRRFTASLLGATLAFSALAQAGLAEGEVRKVDRAIGKITLKHGEIRNLDMPPMTMVFAVTDKALLDKVKAGDKVSFAAAKDAAGNYVVTDLRPRQ
jgi:Cu(I)/Ag(I) efflux system protein CusF